MPRGDGTGPRGMGPMTGRGAGFCTGNGIPGFISGMVGLGLGLGRGGGRGRRNMFYATGLTAMQRAAMNSVSAQAATAPTSTENEKRSLETLVGSLQSQLDAVKTRLTELETKKE